MAESSTRIVITAEDRASGNIGKVGDSLQKLSGAGAGLGALKTALGGLAGAFSAGALIGFAKSTIDAADNLNDLSQKVGISIKDLATWQLAAEQSGTSLESVARGVKALAVNMTENGAALKAAGITATDANGAMVQLADLFKSMPDGVEKTALAVKLFGKAGMDMIPMLNLGSKGLAEAQEKAARYADRMRELAPKADEFNDKLAELGINAKAAGIALLTPLMSGLNDLAGEFVRVTKDGETFRSKLAEIADIAMSPVAALAGMPVDAFKRLTSGQNKSGVVGGKPGTTGWDLRADASGVAMLPGENSAAEKADRARAAKLLQALGGGEKKGKSELQRMIDLGQKNELDAYYDTGGEETQRIVAEKRAIEAAREETRERQRANEAADQAVRKYRDMIDPLQKYRVQLEEVANLSGLSDDERLEATWRINDAMDAEIDKLNGVGDAVKKATDFGRDMGLTFASAFEDAILDGKEFGDVLKGLAKDIERIVLRKTVTEPLGNAISDMIDSSGFSLGGIFSGVFGGGRAAGGAVSPGQFYVVGENGPEILVPGGGGSVIPNGAIAAAGMQIHIHEAPGTSATVQPSADGLRLDIIIEQIEGAMGRRIANGNGLAPGLERRYGLNAAFGAVR